jgi:hypothetical protein
MDIVKFWNACPTDSAPFVHPEDWLVLSKHGRGALDYPSVDFEAYIRGSRFGSPTDNRFHLSLLPIPFAGDLVNADIVVLGLNPGLAPTDYYAEYVDATFRARMLANLRQDLTDHDFRFPYLDPSYCWHSGFVWWEAKFRSIASALARERYKGIYTQGLRHLAHRVAAIELVPYHSVTFADPTVMKKLPSAGVARLFVTRTIIPRVKKRDAVLIVTRQASGWGLPTDCGENLVVCKGVRQVSLSENTEAGRAIRRHLQERPLRMGNRVPPDR